MPKFDCRALIIAIIALTLAGCQSTGGGGATGGSAAIALPEPTAPTPPGASAARAVDASTREAVSAGGRAIQAGAAIELVGSSTRGYALRSGGTIPFAAATVESGFPHGAVIDRRVNRRNGPGTENARIDSLDGGTPVTVLEQRAGWYRLSDRSGGQGWIRADFVRVNLSAAGDDDPRWDAYRADLRDYAKARAVWREATRPGGVRGFLGRNVADRLTRFDPRPRFNGCIGLPVHLDPNAASPIMGVLDVKDRIDIVGFEGPYELAPSLQRGPSNGGDGLQARTRYVWSAALYRGAPGYVAADCLVEENRLAKLDELDQSDPLILAFANRRSRDWSDDRDPELLLARGFDGEFEGASCVGPDGAALSMNECANPGKIARLIASPAGTQNLQSGTADFRQGFGLN